MSTNYHPHYINQVELRTSSELLNEPVLLTRSDNERCLIESSINSARISFRFKFEDADPIEQILGKKFLGFLMKRAEDYLILRRVPIDVRNIATIIIVLRQMVLYRSLLLSSLFL